MKPSSETLLSTETVQVRIMTLDGGAATAWHYHTEVTDRMLCLEGDVAVEYRNPPARVALAPGDRCDVPVERIHRVVNLVEGPSKYLLVQGVGRYDFNAVDP